MASTRVVLVLGILAAGGAVLWQVLLRDLIYIAAGFGRVVQPLSDFPEYTCRRIETEPRLRACEDMWLSKSTRTLYLACSSVEGRSHWMPYFSRLNATGRSTTDAMIALSIDEPAGPNGQSFAHRVLAFPPNFVNAAGKPGTINPNGFGAQETADGNIEFWITNFGPPIDVTTGKDLDATLIGANATIEHFRLKGGDSGELELVATHAGPGIETPNRVVARPDGKGFWLTNDHGNHKTGWKHSVAHYIRLSDVTYCDAATNACKRVAESFRAGNGLIIGPDGRLYVSDSPDGLIMVYDMDETTNELKLVHKIPMSMPVDNLSVDRDGIIYAAAFPKAFEMLASFEKPYEIFPPSTILRIRRVQGQDGNGKEELKYEVDKVIEDAHGEKLPPSTTVVHDAKTGRLFISNGWVPYITVCDKTPT